MGAEDRAREDGEKARALITSALLGELSRRVMEYENAVTWNTSCLSCPAVLDSAYAETVCREKAEATLAAVLAYGRERALTHTDAGTRQTLAGIMEIIGSEEGESGAR